MTIDPDAARVIQLVTLLGRPPLETLPLAEARLAAARGFAGFAAPPPALAAVEDLPGGPGTAGVPMRLYRARPPGAAAPAIIFFHGGGWVLGSLDTHDPFCRHLAHAIGGSVLAVGYRLAPEHGFPAAVEDAAAATRFVQRHAAAWGLEPSRLFLAGDSAGGTLATVVAQARRGTGLAGQILIYPATDLARPHLAPPDRPGHVLLGPATIAWFKRLYLGTPSRALDPRASPLRQPDLAGLPPAFIVTAGQDLLCPEAEAYAEALRRAGTRVRHLHYPGQVHGFLTMDRVIGAATECLGQIAAFVAAPAGD